MGSNRTHKVENVNKLLSVFSEMDTTSKAEARKEKHVDGTTPNFAM